MFEKWIPSMSAKYIKYIFSDLKLATQNMINRYTKIMRYNMQSGVAVKK